MAFPAVPGYGQLSNGNFSAVIYSKKVQLAFRKSSVVEDITNNDYFGEIAQMGDSVKIIKEPEVSVQAYKRGTQITAIAKQYNASVHKIRNVLKARGFLKSEYRQQKLSDELELVNKINGTNYKLTPKY